jgi:hypothetical protein
VIKILLYLFSFILLAGNPLLASAQKIITTYHKDSTVILTRDDRLDRLITKQKDYNTLKQTMPGYRIQIYFGGVRPKASEVKLDFSGKHSDVPSYISYTAPNFKVRVGDFRTRLEAVKFMKSIEGQYPTIFIVPDEIALPPLK